MMRNPYSQFAKRELTLNDHLAIDRTVLANERTLLSYIRTALTLLVIGGTCFKFFDVLWLNVVGVAFMGFSGVTALRGWQRYRRMRMLLKAALVQETGASRHPLESEAHPESGPARDKERAGSSE